MPAQNEDLHGMVPDKSDAALLLLDVINDLDFPESDQLLRYFPAAARRIAALKRRARAAGIPAIYVNDNFGRWQSDFRRLVAHVTAEGCKGRKIARLLMPEEDDYFVLKPKHSGFYSTGLDILLHYLQVRTVILTGVAGNICVLFTANDAYMRDYYLVVPSDCVASNTTSENRHALEQMRKVLKADTTPSPAIDLLALLRHRCPQNADKG
jgi:nicotinamidase-related amidase